MLSLRSINFLSAWLALFVGQLWAASTFTPLVTGANWIGWATYVDSKPAYFEDGFVVFDTLRVNSTLVNYTDFACSNTKKVCIVATDFIYVAFTSDGTAVKKNEVYRVRDQSALKISAKIGIIEDADYFLTSSLSRYGLARWKFGKTDSYASVNFTGISESLDTYDLLIIPSSPWAIVSYSGYNSLAVANFVTMTDFKRVTVNAGLLAPLTSDLSKGYIVNAVESSLIKINYYEGTIKGDLKSPSFIISMKNVPGSDWVVAVGFRVLMVFDLTGDTFSAWTQRYYESTGVSVSGLWLDQTVGTLLNFGLGFINTVAETDQGLCHPSCTACTKWLVSGFCSACTTQATLSGTKCTLNAVTAPPGGAIVYPTAPWSEDNNKPAPPSGFNIKDYYLYFIIGGAGILGICCLYCLIKMCCGDKEEKNNKVHSRDYDE